MSRARDLADLGGSANAGTVTGESLIINGDMAVAQRNSSSAVTAANDAATVDRFKFNEGTDGTYTSEQSSTAPDGFFNSVKLAVTGADTSLSASQYAYFYQSIEAQNLQHLNYGTASAKTLTLSFWVRSSKTGTYCVTLDKNDATRYHFIKEYSIDTADTWEYKTITIAPDSNIKASGGAIANDNGHGIRVFWWLASGTTYNGATDNAWSSDTNDFVTTNQVNWMDSTSNDFYITGIKLEVGSTATDFKHESYAENLAKCHRYYFRQSPTGSSEFVAFGSGVMYNSTLLLGSLSSPVNMRVVPSIGYSGTVSVIAGNVGYSVSALIITGDVNFPRHFRIEATSSSSITVGHGAYVQLNQNAVLDLDAEL
jgi:hypothetical protein